MDEEMIMEFSLVKEETEVIDVERELDDMIMYSLIDGSEDEGEENGFQDDPGCKIINCKIVHEAKVSCFIVLSVIKHSFC